MSVPYGKGEHAPELGHALHAPLLPTVDDDLGIAIGFESVSVLLERRPELAKIVDASIEDNRDGAILVVHRLASARWIDDCETSVAERDAGRHEIAFAIWSTMAQAVGHADD